MLWFLCDNLYVIHHLDELKCRRKIEYNFEWKEKRNNQHDRATDSICIVIRLSILFPFNLGYRSLYVCVCCVCESLSVLWMLLVFITNALSHQNWIITSVFIWIGNWCIVHKNRHIRLVTYSLWFILNELETIAHTKWKAINENWISDQEGHDSNKHQQNINVNKTWQWIK